MDQQDKLIQDIIVDADVLNLSLAKVQDRLEAVDELTQRVILGFDVLETTLGRIGRHALAALAWASFFALVWLLLLGVVRGWGPMAFVAVFIFIALGAKDV